MAMGADWFFVCACARLVALFCHAGGADCLFAGLGGTFGRGSRDGVGSSFGTFRNDARAFGSHGL